jgi:hypothetical protein
MYIVAIDFIIDMPLMTLKGTPWALNGFEEYD